MLDAFKKTKVGLTVQSQYDPTKVARAVTILRELLAAHGHQFSTIQTDVKTIPPASVSITFIIKEGPKVEVGKIQFTGNQHISALQLRRAMKNLRPIGIPRSILLENLFPRTFDATKLEEDAERVRQAYRDRGYFKANVGEPTTRIRNEGGLSLFTFRPKKGKRIDIRMPIEEGDRYRLGRDHLLRQQGCDQRHGPACPVRDEGRGLVRLHARRQGSRESAQGVWPPRVISTSSAIPTPTIDEAKKTVA